ncbi:MAG: hypothetical protein [Wendovervirus sonii]|uniref:Uncharacterized protein n=1 Tax=phage Lak_Megaphage_Sonny TaxID=3109229 RepID=A0ABZ0Z3M7_9CAUD|nr:MAG: hypothetical protein [phage Lak_Megaphage_Sonny]
MGIVKYFFNMFHKQASAIENIRTESEKNDEFVSQGFNMLMDILNSQIDTMETIKAEQKQRPHQCWNLPLTHPYHDTWD